MKKIFKKSMPILMAGIMLLGSIAPTFATVNDIHTVTSNSNQQTEVIYNQESNFEVTVPKLVDLGNDKTTNYLVGVTGDISSDEVIKVIPDESFLMKDVSGTTNLKADVTATVTQDKTEWIFNEFATNGNGTISAPDLTAGTWEGKFNFNIKLEALIEEQVVLEAGLYDINGVMLASWEESGIDVEMDYVEASSYGDNYYKTAATSGYYVLTNYYPTATNIIIPEDVTRIGNCTFKDCANLQKVVIPEDTTIIGAYAFYNCTNLTNITIPKSVTKINYGAFASCNNLIGELDLSNVANMGGQAFSSCSKIESIILSDNLTDLGTTGPTFGSCTNLSKVIYKGETYTSYTLLNAALKANGVTFSSDPSGNPFEGTALTE